MVSLRTFEDIVRAMSEAIHRVAAGLHDPHAAHARIREFYNWKDVTERTERVYQNALSTPETDLWTRIKRYVASLRRGWWNYPN